jgi:hypothetical protein
LLLPIIALPNIFGNVFFVCSGSIIATAGSVPKTKTEHGFQRQAFDGIQTADGWSMGIQRERDLSFWSRVFRGYEHALEAMGYCLKGRNAVFPLTRGQTPRLFAKQGGGYCFLRVAKILSVFRPVFSREGCNGRAAFSASFAKICAGIG